MHGVMTTPALPKTIRHDSGGGCMTVFIGAFLVPMSGSIAHTVLEHVTLPPLAVYGTLGGLALTLLLLVHYFFSNTWVVDVDTLGITIRTGSFLGPIRGPLKVQLETRWASVNRVVDETQVRTTKHGNTQKTYVLRIGDYRFDSALLGVMDRSGKYLELVEAIRAAVGDKLVAREDLGELGAAVERMVEQRIREHEAGKGSDD